MKLLVAGARLQGTEAIYLAKKAGYYVIAVDIDPDAPGSSLADEFFCADINEYREMALILKKADMIIPALENLSALRSLQDYSRRFNIPFIFDMDAYLISRSKKKSNKLFRELKLALPEAYPACSFPVIIKPDSKSGSEKVFRAYSKEEAVRIFEEYPDENFVIQEFLDGPSYSLEVIGDGKNFFFPQITQVITDEDYDCSRIIAPAAVSGQIREQMLETGRRLAGRLKIKGIFDIEVIEDKGTLRLLEIDARLPSQTPVSVYHSKQVNMVKLLVEIFSGKNPEIPHPDRERCCLYQQILVEGAEIYMAGEHIMADAGHLRLIENFFGADEVITDYTEGAPCWRAIVIICKDSRKEAFCAFDNFINEIKTNVCTAAAVV